jgi:uncharacterized protein
MAFARVSHNAVKFKEQGHMAEHLPFDESSFSGALPLFPLPNVVLLPGGLLSLHIFEERYREMVLAALEQERYIGMAVLKPGYEDEYDKNPPVYERACLGEVTRDHKFPDGRWLITLRGMKRVRIVEEHLGKSYRVAEVSIVEDISGTLDIELCRLRSLVAQTTLRTPDNKLNSPEELHRLLGASPDLVAHSLYFDLISAITALNLDQRRAILEATSICERAHTLLEALTKLVIESRESTRTWNLCELSSN